MHNTSLKLLASALLTSALLTACGGGGGGDAVPPPVAPDVVPAEASASPEAFTAWAKSQPPSETSEPLGMGGLVTAPTSDTTDAASLY
ncbi:MAG TPA: hypothetical protein VFL64_10245 [Rhizobacter sp.]|nr:hypothetical protein [Rhizobacter sp.]